MQPKTLPIFWAFVLLAKTLSVFGMEECYMDPAQGQFCPLTDLTGMTLIYPGGTTACYDTQENAPFMFQFQRGQNGDENKLFVYFQSGGLCNSEESCIAVREPRVSEGGIFEAGNNMNSFKDWNIVGISYCSGDCFLGDSITTNDFRFNGRNNVKAVVDWIEDNLLTMPLENVVLSGSSAGSIGVMWWSNPILKMLKSLPNPPRTSVFMDALLGVADPLVNGYPTQLWNACSQEDFAWTNLQYTECMQGTLTLQKLMLSTLADNPDTPFAFISSKFDIVVIPFNCRWRSLCSQASNNFAMIDFLSEYNDLNDNVISYLMNEAFHASISRRQFYSRSSGSGEPTLKEWIDSIVFRTSPQIKSSCVPRSVWRFLRSRFDYSCDADLTAATFVP